MREPDGIALSDVPFLRAELVAGDLLDRFDVALAQVRHNGADLSHEFDATRTSEPERVVLIWQADGSLAAAPTSDTATSVLIANGFVHDESTGTYRLSGDDTADQARAVRKTGAQLAALGLTTALQHPATLEGALEQDTEGQGRYSSVTGPESPAPFHRRFHRRLANEPCPSESPAARARELPTPGAR